MQKNFNYYTNYSSHRLCIGEVETPYWKEPVRSETGALWRLISWKILKVRTWNLHTILIKVLMSQNLGSISFTVRKLCAFRHRRNFGHFWITFKSKGNFNLWWFQRKDLVHIYHSQPYFHVKQWNDLVFFLQFLQFFLYSPTIASEKSHQNLSDYIHFFFKYLNSIKLSFFLVKKMRNSGNLADSINEVDHSFAPCEGIFKFRHTSLVLLVNS